MKKTNWVLREGITALGKVVREALIEDMAPNLRPGISRKGRHANIRVRIISTGSKALRWVHACSG